MNIERIFRSLGVIEFKIEGAPATQEEYEENVEVLADGIKPPWDTVVAAQAAYLAEQPSRDIANIREKRNNLLGETDYFALSDVTMSPEMANYRQALRDLPSTVDINNPVYPEKP